MNRTECKNMAFFSDAHCLFRRDSSNTLARSKKNAICQSGRITGEKKCVHVFAMMTTTLFATIAALPAAAVNIGSY